MRPQTSRPAPAPAGGSFDDLRSWVAAGSWVGDDDVGPVAPGSRWGGIDSETAWRAFLGTGFLSAVLRREGEVVVAAEALARRGHARELVALDRSWGQARAALPPDEPSLGDASARVGRRQLERLRPLRDQRWLDRYRTAVAAGEAHAWHPVVSGILLGVFALPLRPGLQHYGRQVAAGMLAATPLAPRLSGPQRESLLGAAEPAVAEAVAWILPAGPLDVV